MKTLRLLLAVLIATFLCFSSNVAHAEGPICGDRKEIVTQLKDKYQEVQVAFGITPQGMMLEVFASDQTWTIVITDPNGIACLAVAGTDWQSTGVKGNGI